MNFVIWSTVLLALAFVLVRGDKVQVLNSDFGAGELSGHLQNKNYIKKHIDCILAKGDCDSVGRQLKVAIPEVLAKDCKQCSSKQAANAKRLIAFMKTSYPAEWSQIVAKYKK